MTANEFNTKYAKYIPKGWYGLEFDIPSVTEWLDSIMQGGLVNIGGFELHQIKLKFGMARFYFQTEWEKEWLEMTMQRGIEAEINKLVENYYKEKKDLENSK